MLVEELFRITVSLLVQVREERFSVVIHQLGLVNLKGAENLVLPEGLYKITVNPLVQVREELFNVVIHQLGMYNKIELYKDVQVKVHQHKREELLQEVVRNVQQLEKNNQLVTLLQIEEVQIPLEEKQLLEGDN